MPLINLTEIENNDPADEDLFNSRFAAIVDVLNGNIDDDNLAAGAVTTDKLANLAVTGEKLAELRAYYAVNGTAGALQSNVQIVYGMFTSAGGGTGNVSGNVDFGITFASPPVVIVSYAAAKTTAVQPDDTAELTLESSSLFAASTDDITTTGCKIRIHRDDAVAMSSGTYFGANWVAFGPVD